jgi:hypothetical protein
VDVLKVELLDLGTSVVEMDALNNIIFPSTTRLKLYPPDVATGAHVHDLLITVGKHVRAHGAAAPLALRLHVRIKQALGAAFEAEKFKPSHIDQDPRSEDRGVEMRNGEFWRGVARPDELHPKTLIGSFPVEAMSLHSAWAASTRQDQYDLCVYTDTS